MLDRERADFFAALASLQSAFGSHVVATEIPIGSEHEVRGVIDLIDMRAWLHEGDGREAEVEAEIPEELAGLAAEYREKLMDEVAENSDSLMERYLEGVEISHEETVTALKKGVTEGHLFPVTCGVATRNLGTGRLLEALVEDLPSPAMRGPRTILDGDGEAVEIEPDEDGRADRAGVQDDGRPLHGQGQRAPGALGHAALRQPPAQRDPQRPRAGRTARRAARQGDGGRSTSSAPATSAPWRSSRRRPPATCSAPSSAR